MPEVRATEKVRYKRASGKRKSLDKLQYHEKLKGEIAPGSRHPLHCRARIQPSQEKISLSEGGTWHFIGCLAIGMGSQSLCITYIPGGGSL